MSAGVTPGMNLRKSKNASSETWRLPFGLVSEGGVEPIAHHFTVTAKFLLGQG